MDVILVGDGPAADSVAASLSETRAGVERGDPAALADAEVGVVVGAAGSDRFARANDAAAGAGRPWLAVELGGLAGHGVEDLTGAVAGFAPATGCYDCLRRRVAANYEAGPRPDADEVDPADARVLGAIAGRAVARRLDDGDGVWGRVVEWPHAERSFLPVPGCDTCGLGTDRELTLEAGDRDLEAALAAAEQALDDRVGLVTEVGEVESFPAPYYLARTSDTNGFSDVAAAGQAAGVAGDWNAAFMKALGEALERYCAGVYRGPSQRAPPGTVEEAVDPAAFVGVEGTADAIPWVPGVELRGGEGGPPDDGSELRGEAAWLPAELVQFPPPERRLTDPITTGLGLGNSSVEAVLSGLYEVVERDATMLSWYSTFDPLGLSVEDDRFENLARRARGVGLSVTPLLVTQDVDVPVVAVAVHRDGDWPNFAVGSAADLAPGAAARSALAEALQNWMELRSMGPEAAAEESGAIAEYADFPPAARDFVDADGAVPAASVAPDDGPTGRAELAAVVARVQDAGLTPYAARVTTPDVEALGFEAVRALVPGAQPLFTGEPTFGERARTVPTDLGFEPALDRPYHPYP